MTVLEQARALQLNSRYVAYATSQGRSPAIQLAHDAASWPGGRMAGYVIWIGTELRSWKTLRGLRHDDHMTDADQDAFDAWLSERYSGDLAVAA